MNLLLERIFDCQNEALTEKVKDAKPKRKENENKQTNKKSKQPKKQVDGIKVQKDDGDQTKRTKQCYGSENK
jgi:hypothetical protein